MKKLTQLVVYTCGNCSGKHATFAASFETAPENYTQVDVINEGDTHYENIASMILQGDGHMVSAYLKGVDTEAKSKAETKVTADANGVNAVGDITGFGIINTGKIHTQNAATIPAADELAIKPAPYNAEPLQHYQAENVRINLLMQIAEYKKHPSNHWLQDQIDTLKNEIAKLHGTVTGLLNQ